MKRIVKNYQDKEQVFFFDTSTAKKLINYEGDYGETTFWITKKKNYIVETDEGIFQATAYELFERLNDSNDMTEKQIYDFAVKHKLIEEL